MEQTIVQTIEIPPEIGVCKERFSGDSKFTLAIVASDPGYSAQAEDAVLQVLYHIHSIQTMDCVFINLDAAQKSGHITPQQDRIDISKYKSFEDVTACGLAISFMVKQGLISAAYGFGVVEPAVHLQPVDDWINWARSSELLRDLSVRAGKTEMMLAFLENLIDEQCPDYTLLQALIKLIHLEWDVSEWDKHQNDLKRACWTSILAPLHEQVPDIESMDQFLSHCTCLASEFYEVSLARADELSRRAIKLMEHSGSFLGALVVGVNWIDHIVDILHSEGVSFFLIIPQNVSMSPILDQAGVLLRALDGSQWAAQNLFSNDGTKTRVKAVQEKDEELDQTLGLNWVAAAQACMVKYQNGEGEQNLDLAEQCVAHALRLSRLSADAWWIQGEIYKTRCRYQEALDCMQQAVRLGPREGLYRSKEAAVLDKLGRQRQACNVLIKGIYCSPHDGGLWNELGQHYLNSNRRDAACYCFMKGSQYGNANATQNQRDFCHYPVSWRTCPPSLLPLAIFFMYRIALPLIYDKEFVLKVEMQLSLVFLLATVPYGIVIGAIAGGIIGGILGFILFTIVALIFLFVAGVSDVAVSNIMNRTSKKGFAFILGVVCFIMGITYGAHQGVNVGSAITLGGTAWNLLKTTLAGLLGAAVGGWFFCVIPALIVFQVQRNMSGEVKYQKVNLRSIEEIRHQLLVRLYSTLVKFLKKNRETSQSTMTIRF